jgi:hypothetical protein
MVESRIVIPVVVGSSPISHPIKSYGLLAQLVRSLACHARGHGFESRTVRQIISKV